MATKVNADNLQKLSTTHKNVSSSVKAKASKAQATVSKLKLDTSRNTAVKAVPARAQVATQRVTTKTATISTRSTELAKRADYVREQAALASKVKAPTKKVSMPATTASATKARTAAAKLSTATRNRPTPPIVKPLPRRPTVLRPVPPPKRKDSDPVIKEQFKRTDILPKIRRVEVLKGAGGKVRVYTSTATNTKVGGRTLPTAVQTTTVKTNKAGPHDNPVKKVETRSDKAILFSSQAFVGESGSTTMKGVKLDGAIGAYASTEASLKREGGKTQLNATANVGLTARATATTGFDIGRGPLALKVAAKGTVMGGANAGAEVAASYSSRQASLKTKAGAFAGVGAEGEGSLEILPGVKVILGGGVNAGIGATAQGEVTVSPNRLKIGGGIGATFGPGGKVNAGLEVNVPRLVTAVGAGVTAVRRTPAVQAIERRAPPVVRAVARVVQPVARVVAPIVRKTAAVGVQIGTAVDRGVRRVATATYNGAVRVGQVATQTARQGVAAVQQGAAATKKAATTAFTNVGKWTGLWGS